MKALGLIGLSLKYLLWSISFVFSLSSSVWTSSCVFFLLIKVLKATEACSCSHTLQTAGSWSSTSTACHIKKINNAWDGGKKALNLVYYGHLTKSVSWPASFPPWKFCAGAVRWAEGAPAGQGDLGPGGWGRSGLPLWSPALAQGGHTLCDQQSHALSALQLVFHLKSSAFLFSPLGALCVSFLSPSSLRSLGAAFWDGKSFSCSSSSAPPPPPPPFCP